MLTAPRLAALVVALALAAPSAGVAEERGRCEGAREGSILTVELAGHVCDLRPSLRERWRARAGAAEPLR